MELREWKYINNSTTNSVYTSSGEFRSRLKKLATMTYRYKSSQVDSVDIITLADNEIKFIEFFKNGATAEYEISIKPTTEAWNLIIYTTDDLDGRKKVFDGSGTGWEALIKELRYYITLPTVGTPEYKDLLTESFLKEWKLMSPPLQAAFSGYKKRFERLIKYHIDHASSELERVIRKDIKEDGFHLGEHYNTGSQEFDRDIIVSIDKATGTFYLNIFVDGKKVYNTQCKDYETLVEILDDDYMYLTYKGAEDFDELISESLSIAKDFKLYESLWD